MVTRKRTVCFHTRRGDVSFKARKSRSKVFHSVTFRKTSVVKAPEMAIARAVSGKIGFPILLCSLKQRNGYRLTMIHAGRDFGVIPRASWPSRSTFETRIRVPLAVLKRMGKMHDDVQARNVLWNGRSLTLIDFGKMRRWPEGVTVAQEVARWSNKVYLRKGKRTTRAPRDSQRRP